MRAGSSTAGGFASFRKGEIMLIDAHVHLDRYGTLLDEALCQIDRERIFTIATAMDLPSYLQSIEIAHRSKLVLPTFGVHPRRAADYADRLRGLDRHIEQSPAIGEIGLDFHWVKETASYPAQKKVLEYCLAAAHEQNKFVNLHTKGGERQILDLLEKYDVKRAIIHWYSGPMDILRAMIEYGCYFTIGVEIHTSEHIRNIAVTVPDHLILTETDNPGGLKWLKGIVGMPVEIAGVSEALADLRHTTSESIIRTVHSNLSRLFRDDPWLASTRALLGATAA